MYAEAPAHSPELSIDLAEAQHLLGYAVAPLLDPEIAYDERLVICEQALAAKESRRNALGSAAKAAGIALAPGELESWQPDEHDLSAIRQSLQRERKRARMLDGLALFIDDGRLKENAFGEPLWSNQRDMVMDTEEFAATKPRTYEKGGKGGVISGPPGCGKTGVISALCAGLKYNEDPHERLRIVVLENTQNVMHQTHGQSGERGFGKFAPHLDVGLRYQERKDLDHDIVIMPFASFNLLMERGEMPDFDVVIGDEGDIYCTGQTGTNLREYTADKTLIMVTATPDEATYDLAPHDIYSMNLPEGIHDGLLAPTTGLVRRIAGVDETTPRDEFLRACMEDAKPLIRKAIEAGVGVLVHCPAGDDITAARDLAKELRMMEVRVPNPMDGTWPDYFKTVPRNIRAIAIGGKKQASRAGKRFQQTVFRQYNESDVDALVFVQAIGRGDDFPGAKLLIDLEPRTVNAWRAVVQLGGRVTRLVKDKDRKPLPATWITYYDPRMNNQYTSVMALGGDTGQDVIRVTQQRNVSTLPARKLRSRVVADYVVGAEAPDAQTIDTIQVDHTVAEQAPEESVSPMGARALARYLLVSEVTMDQIFQRERMKPGDELDAVGVELLLEYYPHLRPKPLPDAGYTSVPDLITLLGRTDIKGARHLRQLAKPYRTGFHRFAAPGMAPEFYIADDEAEALLTALNRPTPGNLQSN